MKCLVTKLKESLSNPKLDRLDCIVVHCNKVQTPSGNTRFFNVNGLNKAVIVPTGSEDAYFTDESQTVNNGKEKTGEYFWVSNAECDLYLYGKYNLTTLSMNADRYFLSGLNFLGINGGGFESTEKMFENISDISFIKTSNFKKLNIPVALSPLFTTDMVNNDYKDNLTTLGLNTWMTDEPLSALCKFDNIAELSIQFSNVKGLLSDLGVLTKLTYMYIPETRNIVGSIEEFVRAQRANGRATCTKITMLGLERTNITFNGQACSGTGDLSWTASSITLDGVTISA